MSAGRKLPWSDAAAIAKQLVADLTPVVARVKTVGSVRRRRELVGDIELLAEPRLFTAGFFGETAPDLDAIRAVAHGWGSIEKAGERFIQVRRPDGLHVDLFLCYAPAQWGSLLAIRTGPAELGTHAVTRMKVYGLRHTKGHVENAAGELVPTPTEEDFFAAARLPCLSPALRDTPAAWIPTI